MNKFVESLFLICVLITITNPSFSEDDVVTHSQTSEYDPEQINANDSDTKGRSIADAADNNDNSDKNSKPLRSIFLGIYKNYKSTYLGNKTLTEYKQTLREQMKNKQQPHELNVEIDDEDSDGIVTTYPSNVEEEEEEETEGAEEDDEKIIEETTATTIVPQPTKIKLSPNRKKKLNATTQTKNRLHRYNVGPTLNLSLDMDNSVVKVNLDGESLKELVTGRWLSDNTEEGRGKKYEIVTRILPLFILPFLIQSAIVPFLVTKLKLLLMKSILVGKLAIFLLIISAFRNSNKQMQTYEVAPSYWSGEPSRRSELAAAASNMAYNGYRVEGKPAAWIN